MGQEKGGGGWKWEKGKKDEEYTLTYELWRRDDWRVASTQPGETACKPEQSPPDFPYHHRGAGKSPDPRRETSGKVKATFLTGERGKQPCFPRSSTSRNLIKPRFLTHMGEILFSSARLNKNRNMAFLS
jgi:hypothetical protein